MHGIGPGFHRACVGSLLVCRRAAAARAGPARLGCARTWACSADQVAFLQAQGAVPFAYLSVGELSPEDEVSADAAQLSSGERNHEWQSDIADLASPQWQQHLLERAARLRSQGYRGLFLDTLDSFMRLPEERRPAQLQGLVALLQRLHAEYPDLQLFFNRGFEALPELGFAPAAVAVESLEASWDQAQGQYGRVSESDRAWLDGQLKPLLDAGTPVVAIEYLPPEQREQARELSQRLQQQGYLPVITTPELDSLGVGTLEVVPRRIALLYDPREGELTRSPGHVLLGGLLEYLGYRVDYFAVDGHLPGRRFDELYAGVVVWMTSGAPAQAGQFRRFFAGAPGRGHAHRILWRYAGRRRAPARPSGPAPPAIRAERGQPKQVDAALVGSFEAPLRLRARDLLALSADESRLKPALQLQDDQSKPADTSGYGRLGRLCAGPIPVSGVSLRASLDAGPVQLSAGQPATTAAAGAGRDH
ncbi:endo alpha-1,4 polygalactosaminidase [Halopseudomonas pachastrellae]|nr:endo alpha-1,4 polygalactosaminidase [Halopseudomonas pachastrellae]